MLAPSRFTSEGGKDTHEETLSAYESPRSIEKKAANCDYDSGDTDSGRLRHPKRKALESYHNEIIDEF